LSLHAQWNHSSVTSPVIQKPAIRLAHGRLRQYRITRRRASSCSLSQTEEAMEGAG